MLVSAEAGATRERESDGGGGEVARENCRWLSRKSVSR
jgi:hypothetical protein